MLNWVQYSILKTKKIEYQNITSDFSIISNNISYFDISYIPSLYH